MNWDLNWGRMTGARPLAWLGVGVGIVAAIVALPPYNTRTAVAPIVIGLIALTLGIGSWARGERKVGLYAILSGVLFGLLGWGATRSSVGNLEAVVVWSALLGSMLRYATPLIFAALGGLFSERSGVVNIGLEGMMLTGGFFAIWGAVETGSWQWGLLIGIVSGALMATIHAFFSIHLRADQIVGGTAIIFLALGLTSYLYIDIYGEDGVPSEISTIPNVSLDFLSGPLGFLADLPAVGGVFATLGDVLGNLNLMIWLGLLTIVLTWVVVFKTPIGLRLRAVGEHPRAADTVGISVYGVRYAAVIFSGMMAAAGGAYLTLGFVGSFSDNITAGRGFIALAALICGNWRPFQTAAICLLFGFSQAIAQRLPVYAESAGVPINILFEALPYVITLIAVAGVIGRSTPPAAVGRPYKKS